MGSGPVCPLPVRPSYFLFGLFTRAPTSLALFAIVVFRFEDFVPFLFCDSLLRLRCSYRVYDNFAFIIISELQGYWQARCLCCHSGVVRTSQGYVFLPFGPVLGELG